LGVAEKIAMEDLFAHSSGGSPERIELPDADILMYWEFLPRAEADGYLTTLLEQVVWRENEVFVWGKWRKQPRLVSWFGDPGATYSYSGSKMDPQPWTPTLQKLRRRVEGTVATAFNSVLLNLYRDQNDRMGWHGDDEPELGPEPTIASVSLGEERDFLLKHRTNRTLGVKHVPLHHGSLLVMAGQTQQTWQHAIEKERRPIGKRINLTFRRILLSSQQ
jgi:alkylated DNA repair dioxygenase AlkB